MTAPDAPETPKLAVLGQISERAHELTHHDLPAEMELDLFVADALIAGLASKHEDWADRREALLTIGGAVPTWILALDKRHPDDAVTSNGSPLTVIGRPS